MERPRVMRVKRMAAVVVLAAWAGAVAVAPSPAGAAGPAGTDARVFEAHWQDSRAELDGYRYRVTRYGEERRGQAVMVFVTEPWSASRHVKADHPTRNPADTFEALKLNLVRDWQTGIYDYNTMVSVFTRSRDFSLDKISFSAMEWCGNVYEELIFEPRRITDRIYSYFEAESGYRTLPRREGGVQEDQLFILLRGLRGVDFLKPGEKRMIPFLASPFYRRLGHREAGWGIATVERLPVREVVRVPAGRFECDVYTVRPRDGRDGRIDLERAYPHRIIRWSWTPPAKAQGWMGRDGCDSGELVGSKRLPYWQLNANGNETYLPDLGLLPGAPAPPPEPEGR
jgi:hypothetical protein